VAVSSDSRPHEDAQTAMVQTLQQRSNEFYVTINNNTFFFATIDKVFY
jgi:hypothetical protein